MATAVRWEGEHEFDAALEAMVARARVASREFVVRGAHLAQEAMRRRAESGGHHQAGTPTPAHPGGGPAVISGTLVGSIDVGPVEPLGSFGYAAEVGPTAIYGRRVELSYGYSFTRPGFEESLPPDAVLYRELMAKAVRS